MVDGTANESGGARHTRWSAVLALGIATLLVGSEASLAAFALPLIGDAFGVDSGATAWVLLAYALPLAALAIPAGRWADGADVRTVFAVSLGALALASVLTACAPALWVVLLGRALQGIASAVYLAIYMPVIAGAVSPDQHGRAMSFVQAVMMIGSVAVAPLGGLVAGELGWRAVFWFKVPLLALVLWWGRRVVPARELSGPRLPRPGGGLLKDAVLLGSAVVLALLGLDAAKDGWVLPALLLPAASAVGALWLRSPTARPVVTLLRRGTFGAAALAMLLVSSVSGVVSFSLPFFISDVMGEGPELLSGAMVCFVAAAAVLSPVAGALADKFPASAVATAGAALTALALPTLLTLGPDSGPVDLAWRMTALGAGMALFNSPVMTTLLGCAPHGAEGTAGGVTNLARTLGNTVGPALAALAWGLTTGPASGFRAGVLALTACSATAALALLAARRRRTPATNSRSLPSARTEPEDAPKRGRA